MVVESVSVVNVNVTNAMVVGWTLDPIANVLSANVENLKTTKFVPEMGFVIATSVYVSRHIQVTFYSVLME